MLECIKVLYSTIMPNKFKAILDSTTEKLCHFLFRLSNDGKKKPIMTASIIVACIIGIWGGTRLVNRILIGVCKIVMREDKTRNMSMGDYVVGVEAAKAVVGTTQDEVRSIGYVKGCKEVMLKAEINSKIKQINFTEGSYVKEGDELITLDDVEFNAKKEQAEAEYKLAQADYDRVKSAYEKKAVPLKDYDAATAKLQAAKARFEEAEDLLSKTVIKAPFDGYIGIMKISSGNLVQRGQELAFIVDTSTVFVEFMVPARYSNSVDSGQIVNVNIDAYPDTTFSGVVQAVDSAVDQKNHSIFVKASIDNEKQLLKHGLYANVVLVIGEKTGVILIPEDALAREGSIDYVWVIDKKDRAYRKRVVVGSKSGYYVEIVNGLQEGDVVVVAGHLKLSDGIKAQILNDMNAQTEQVTN